jgi:hypothetical protein
MRTPSMQTAKTMGRPSTASISMWLSKKLDVDPLGLYTWPWINSTASLYDICSSQMAKTLMLGNIGSQGVFKGTIAEANAVESPPATS